MSLVIITFEDARDAGKARFFTGEPCKNGHLSERWVCRKTCIACDMIMRKASYTKSDKMKASQAVRGRRWYLANKEKADANTRKWAHKNKDKVDTRVKNWRTKNPSAGARIAAKYRAAKLKATPSWVDFDRIAEVYEISNFLTRVIGIDHHVDHVIPLQGETVCGLHVAENMQVLIGRVNQSKSNKLNGSGNFLALTG